MQLITTQDEFNASKNQEWKANCGFWADTFKRDELSDNTTKATTAIIRNAARQFENPTIVDVGCGHAWVLDALNYTDGLKRFNYWGLDYMPEFIHTNTKKYKNNKNAHFTQCDIESDKIPAYKLPNKEADIIVNYFNLIEIWNLDTSFNNMSMMLKDNGLLVVGTADAIPYIANQSETRQVYDKFLRHYAHIKTAEKNNTLGFKRQIPNSYPPRYFHFVAHSVADYVNTAASHGLYLSHMDERYNGNIQYPPTVVMQFKKTRGKTK